jgi:thiamine-phosphate pyrophosphorylase
MTPREVTSRLRGFYGVVGWDEDPARPIEPAEAVARAMALADLLLTGGACVLQVRLKHAPVRTIMKVSQALRGLTRAATVPFVVNDRLDVALAVGADAVHLGQDDLHLRDARAVLARTGANLAIGVSTHSAAQAEAAAAAGADYLGFGPVFATATKLNPDPVQGIAALAEAVRRVRPLPIVAIGGITPATAGEVARAGAAAACVIAAVNGASDVTAAARAVGSAFAPAP